MDIQTAIKKYRSLGFNLVFLKPGQKYEVVDTLSQYHADEEVGKTAEAITRQNLNIGLSMNNTIGKDRWIFALDFDDPELYHKWKESRPALAGSPTQQTANGFHVLLTISYRILNAKSEKLDIITDGWYIVVEPSIHPEGQPYKWLIWPFDARIAHVDNLQETGIFDLVEHFEWDQPDYGEWEGSDEYDW